MEPNDPLHHHIGRPRFNVTAEDIMTLKSDGLIWGDISCALGISIRTLFRRRADFTIPPKHTTITWEDGIVLLTEIISAMPNAGERLIRGALLSRGMVIRRSLLRNLLNEVDHVGRAARRSRPIQRRIYNVKGPNHLWHMDTDHKLISWRFVIHGCVDGFSRNILYLRCCLDNTANTAAECFLEGVKEYGVPSRVRGDHGTENRQVARFMLRVRGCSRGSFISGRSVHNQRIEYMWGQVNRLAVTSWYSELFRNMEYSRILNSTNELHMLCLHFVFLPRIQRSLSEIMTSWNNHPMRTENHQSPLSLWHGGFRVGLGASDINVTGLEERLNADEDLGDTVTNNHIVVPQSTLNLAMQDIGTITGINPLLDDGNDGVEHFVNSLHILEQEVTILE